MSDLQVRLLAAHEAEDKSALITLYCQAADAAPSQTATGFFLTHAYIFALELGHARAPALRARLVAMGREDEEPFD